MTIEQLKKFFSYCELCGSGENITVHHTIPKGYPERKHGVRIPKMYLCRKCHTEVHRDKVMEAVIAYFPISSPLSE